MRNVTEQQMYVHYGDDLSDLALVASHVSGAVSLIQFSINHLI